MSKGASLVGSMLIPSYPVSPSSSTCTTISSKRSPNLGPVHAREVRSHQSRWRLRTHAQTAGVSLTAQQPENNIVRVAYQAMAAVLGGTQSLHTNSMDTLALPTEKSVRIALRTQQILAYESGVPNTIDPLAGSYYLESLTDRLETEALELFDRIDELGGVVPGIETGFFQRQIANRRAGSRPKWSRPRLVVGVNEFTDGSEEVEIDTLDRRFGGGASAPTYGRPESGAEGHRCCSGFR